jgi:hypothetical protein
MSLLTEASFCCEGRTRGYVCRIITWGLCAAKRARFYRSGMVCGCGTRSHRRRFTSVYPRFVPSFQQRQSVHQLHCLHLIVKRIENLVFRACAQFNDTLARADFTGRQHFVATTHFKRCASHAAHPEPAHERHGAPRATIFAVRRHIQVAAVVAPNLQTAIVR